MKHIVLSIVFLFMATFLYSQEVFKKGTIVKGKDVVYKVEESKRYPFPWLVRNMQNPDTTLKRIPRRGIISAQELDIAAQIAEIIHDNLSPEELAELEKCGDRLSLILRVDREKYKLLQVTCFSMFYRYPSESRPYDGFWLNLSPDKLYRIERDIVAKVVLPGKMNESYLIDDFEVVIGNDQICDIEQTRKKRQEAVASWKKDTIYKEPILFWGPPEEP